MIDINTEAEKALSALPYKLVFSHPEAWNELPAVSFYDIAAGGVFSNDNLPGFIDGLVAVDVWTREPSQAGTIALEITAVMEADGWRCEMNRFADKTDGIYHRALRFGKTFSDSRKL